MTRFDDVWVHGDYIQKDTRTGQIVFLGRADGVLVGLIVKLQPPYKSNHPAEPKWCSVRLG